MLARIAAEAGVARSTVSLVLSGKYRTARISEARAEQIRAVAQRLDLKPNAAARAMRRQSFNAIGLVTVAGTPGNGIASPFATMWHGVLAAAQKEGLQVLLAGLPPLSSDSAQPFAEWAIDGVLLDWIDHIDPAFVDLLERHATPAVWLNARRAQDCVYPDDYAAAQRLTAELIAVGHRRIAYWQGTPTGHFSAADRRDGYCAAMAAAGLHPEVVLMDGDIPERERQDYFRHRLRYIEPPGAIITYEAAYVCPLYTAALSLGIPVPRRLSLATFHAEPVDICGLPIATMVIPTRELGQVAVATIRERIATGHPVAPRRVEHRWRPGGTIAAPETARPSPA